MADLTLDADGAHLHAAALSSAELGALRELGESLADGTAGERLFGHPLVAQLTGPDSTLRQLAVLTLGPHARPVRAVLFDKSAANNWPLGWHQDRVIAVKARAEVAGYGPFTVKQGILHVQPPPEVIAGMVTLRAHLDPFDDDNAPLLIAKASRQLGLVPVDEVAEVVARSEIADRLAAPLEWLASDTVVHLLVKLG